MDLSNIKFDSNGLVPAIAQDVNTKEVLMLAYMNEESLNKTIETGRAHYYSRSRQQLWLKGETSGHFQHVKEISYDCDGDCILIYVEQIGVACHTGSKTCFFRNIDGTTPKGFEKDDNLKVLYETICDRRENPKEGSYTNYLFEKGIDKMLKKVGEESAEIIIGAKNPDSNEIIYEIADLMYHLSVVMVEKSVSWDDIYNELKKRSEQK